MKTKNDWRRWTLGESLAKISSATLQKQIGIASSSGVGVVLGNLMIGIAQMISVFFVLCLQKKTPKDSFVHILFSLMFGALAFASTMFSMSAYRLGGEVSVVVFIITLSVIPGAIIDTIFFKHPLVLRQWVGVGIGLLGGYLVLGAPNLTSLANLPTWVLLAFGTACTVATNQGLSQKIKGINPLVKNFWGGLSTAVLALCAFTFVGLPDFSSESTWKIVWFSVPIGIIVVLMWTCNVRAYRDGAHIAEKKLMLNGLYLAFAMVVGCTFYGETLTFGKALGVPLFVVATALLDNTLWEFFRGLFQKK